jgi:hypothetical protein
MTYENLFQDGALKQDIPSGDLSKLMVSLRCVPCILSLIFVHHKLKIIV